MVDLLKVDFLFNQRSLESSKQKLLGLERAVLSLLLRLLEVHALLGHLLNLGVDLVLQRVEVIFEVLLLLAKKPELEFPEGVDFVVFEVLLGEVLLGGVVLVANQLDHGHLSLIVGSAAGGGDSGVA